MASELKAFYKKKAKSTRPGEFDYDDDGNIVIRDKEGTVTKTIPLPNYRAPTLEEIGIMEKQRTDAIALANQAFDQARKELNTAIQEGGRSKTDILVLNRRVAEADQTLQTIRFPLRKTTEEEGIMIREIDFSQPSETRKYPYPIYVQNVRPFSLQETYVRAGEAIKQPLISLEEIKEAEKTPVILFGGADTPVYGFLSLNWPVQIADSTFPNPSGFHSARQALAYKMAAAMGDDENRNAIAEITDADAIDYTVEDVPGDANEEKWKTSLTKLVEEVTRMKFMQHPELGEQLRSTKNAVLGADEAGDLLLGIGLSMTEQQAKIQKRWTGENLLGKALMKIRQEQSAPKQSAVVRRPPPSKSAKATVAAPAVAATPAVAASAVPVSGMAALAAAKAAKASSSAPVISIPAVSAVSAPAVPAPVAAPKPKTAAELLAAARAARSAKATPPQ